VCIVSDSTQRRRFGRTGGYASAIGLGTYHLTSDRGVPHHEAVTTIRRARELGINVIDTAPMYGLGEAEQIVGEAIAGTDVSDLIVLGKVGRFEKSIMARLGDQAYRDPPAIRAQFDHSMRLLGLDRLPLLLLHESDWVEWWDDIDSAAGPVRQAVDRMRADGVIGGVGLSVRKTAVAQALCRTGVFDAMLFVHYYNMVWQEAGDGVLPAAAAHDMGVAIGAPYRQGLLTTTDPALRGQLRAQQRSSVPPGIIDRIAAAQEIARQTGLSMVELGLRWLLSDPRVHTVVVGPRSQAELEQNVAWAAAGPLEEAVVKELAALRHIEPGTWDA
jgi:aryl-alcohol dehydrogenase-like predicted oxidoreductase